MASIWLRVKVEGLTMDYRPYISCSAHSDFIFYSSLLTLHQPNDLLDVPEMHQAHSQYGTFAHALASTWKHFLPILLHSLRPYFLQVSAQILPFQWIFSWWLWHCNPHLLSSIFLHTFNTVYIQYIHVFIYLLPALPVKFILKLTPQGLKALFYSTATSPKIKTATCTKKVLN